MTPDQLRTLDLAARYLKTLSAVERAHALGDDDDVEGTLGGVDPIDLKQVTGELEELAKAESEVPVPRGNWSKTEVRDGVTYVERYRDVTHVGDIWSRKV